MAKFKNCTTLKRWERMGVGTGGWMWEGDNVGRGYQVLYLFSCSVWRKGTNLGRHRTCNSVGETLASLRVDTVILCISEIVRL